MPKEFTACRARQAGIRSDHFLENEAVTNGLTERLNNATLGLRGQVRRQKREAQVSRRVLTAMLAQHGGGVLLRHQHLSGPADRIINK